MLATQLVTMDNCTATSKLAIVLRNTPLVRAMREQKESKDDLVFSTHLFLRDQISQTGPVLRHQGSVRLSAQSQADQTKL